MSEERAVTKVESKKKDHEERIVKIEDDPKISKVMAEMVSLTMQSGGLPKEILQKVTEKHIDKVLEIAERTDNYIHHDNKSGRRYAFAFVILSLVLIVFLVLTLKDNNKELLIQILIVLTSIIGGFGAGYGYSKHKSL